MAVGTVTPVALAGCEPRLSTLHTAGPSAEAIAVLWWVMLVGAVLICCLVATLLWLAFQRHEQIFDAIRQGNCDAAEAAMQTHLRESQEAYWVALEQKTKG